LAKRHPPPQCLPGTRAEIINQIIDALTGPNGHPICWLNGMAGSGKSALAQSVAQVFSRQGRLAGGFFFSRTIADHHNAQLFLPTIAYQLSISVPPLKSFILGALEADPSIITKSLHYQLQKLIVEPLLKLPQPSSSMIVFIDALDECEDQSLIGDVIDQVTEALMTYDIPLRFFFTSRPEGRIEAKFVSSSAAAITRSFALCDFNAQGDIRIFLRSRLAGIYAERRQVMCSIPHLWPTPHDLDTLVHRSSGLFIFASTVFKYVDDNYHNPNHRLKEILGADGRSSSSTYRDLDLLYSQILSSVSDISSLQLVLGTIICLCNPLSVEQIQKLLGAERVDISLILERLNSILLIPDDRDAPVQIFHGSLCDFLIDPQRSNPYTVDLLTGHVEMTRACLNVMGTEMHENNGVVEDPESVNSGALRYALDYWTAHLLRSPYKAVLKMDLEKFGVESLLTWIKALRLHNRLENALRCL
jgi:hypothetical protein